MDELENCQKGFTLLEILLSIVLLFIILTSFMGFFTQSAIFTNKNEQKFETSQTAQEVVNLIDEKINERNFAGLNTIKNLIKNEINSPFSIDLEMKENQTSQMLTQIKVIVKDPNKPSDYSETFTYIRR